MMIMITLITAQDERKDDKRAEFVITFFKTATTVADISQIDGKTQIHNRNFIFCQFYQQFSDKVTTTTTVQ